MTKQGIKCAQCDSILMSRFSENPVKRRFELVAHEQSLIITPAHDKGCECFTVWPGIKYSNRWNDQENRGCLLNFLSWLFFVSLYLVLITDI